MTCWSKSPQTIPAGEQVPRIVGGRLRGRRLRVPAGGVRPTSERAREAVFDMLSVRRDFDGIRVLDLYAGSGALGIEALSRGAAHALLVESDRRVAALMRSTVKDLGVSGAVVRTGTVAAVLASGTNEPYDVVFSDPPYALDTAAVSADLAALVAGGWLRNEALVVLERSTRCPETPWPPGFSNVVSRRYGDTRMDLGEYR